MISTHFVRATLFNSPVTRLRLKLNGTSNDNLLPFVTIGLKVSYVNSDPLQNWIRTLWSWRLTCRIAQPYGIAFGTDRAESCSLFKSGILILYEKIKDSVKITSTPSGISLVHSPRLLPIGIFSWSVVFVCIDEVRIIVSHIRFGTG